MVLCCFFAWLSLWTYNIVYYKYLPCFILRADTKSLSYPTSRTVDIFYIDCCAPWVGFNLWSVVAACLVTFY